MTDRAATEELEGTNPAPLISVGNLSGECGGTQAREALPSYLAIVTYLLADKELTGLKALCGFFDINPS